MVYDFVTPNIIKCNNFLPPTTANKVWEDILNTKDKFHIPEWGKPEQKEKVVVNTKEHYSHLCGGTDWWDEYAPTIAKLPDWILHQGLISFIHEQSPKTTFSFIPKFAWLWSVHLICYNRGGYYNWHQDHVTYLRTGSRMERQAHNNLFTANIVLQQPSSLKGGEALFMDDGIHEEPHKNNTMYLFPSYIPHAVKVLEGEEDVSFEKQRFSVQFWFGYDNLETNKPGQQYL